MVLDSGSNYLRAQKLLLFLDRTIKASVAEANQTAMDKAKPDTPPQLEMEEVFAKSKERVFTIIDKGDLKFIELHTGNIDKWINSRIEYYLAKEKI